MKESIKMIINVDMEYLYGNQVVNIGEIISMI